MGAGTAFVVGSLISAAVSAGSAKVQHDDFKKSELTQADRLAQQLKQQRELASKATAPVTKTGGVIELKSSEASEDEELQSRSARSRLRVERSGGSVGTGLTVG